MNNGMNHIQGSYYYKDLVSKLKDAFVPTLYLCNVQDNRITQGLV